VSAHRTPPGSYGEISVSLLRKEAPGEVDLFRSVSAPAVVLDWARTNPEELAKLVRAFSRRNRKVSEIWRAETRFRPQSGGELEKVKAHGPTADKAKAELRERLTSMGAFERGNTDRGLIPTSTMNDLLDEYSRLSLEVPTTGKRQQTLNGKKRVIKRALRPRIGSLRIGEFRGPQVDEFRHQMLADGKEHDLKESFIILRAVMKLAVRWELISVDPMISAEAAPRRSKREVQDAVVYLTAEQVAAVRHDLLQWERDRVGRPGPKPDPQYRWIFETLVGSGTRLNECLAIRKRDVFIVGEAVQLLISGTIVQLDGQGLVRQPKTKTDEPRMVALPKAAGLALRRRLATISDLPDDHLVFCTRNRTPHDDGNIRRAFNRATDKLASVSPEGFAFHPHLTRKSAATAIKQGISREAAAQFLGHADLSNIHAYVPADIPEADVSVVPILDALLPVLDDEDLDNAG
jgi:integrase